MAAFRTRLWRSRHPTPVLRSHGAGNLRNLAAKKKDEAGHEFAAFISYSRAVDGKLAPALQSALQRFTKPWYRLRALRVFRDDASLSANPGLWSSIQEALARSEFFILLASSKAAESKWVDREVAYWVAHKPLSNILIALAGGDDLGDASDIDWSRAPGLPPSLRGVFTEEPRYTDLRWAHKVEHLSLTDAASGTVWRIWPLHFIIGSRTTWSGRRYASTDERSALRA